MTLAADAPEVATVVTATLCQRHHVVDQVGLSATAGALVAPWLFVEHLPAYRHPGASSQRTGMLEIFAGELCGRCHGKTAFAVETNCWRCHDNLVRPGRAAAETDFAKAREAPIPGSPESRRHGESLFQGLCARCHGKNGDGNGPFAPSLNPKPRDFAGRTFKQRVDASDIESVDIGLYRTLSLGINGTAMPAWSALSPSDRWALVHYVKTFASGGF